MLIRSLEVEKEFPLLKKGGEGEFNGELSSFFFRLTKQSKRIITSVVNGSDATLTT